MLLNSKGGCGKTTIATNLAACYASQGRATVLIDHDGQGSSTRWLNARSQHSAPIHGIEAYQEKVAVTKSFLMRLPEGTERVVIDTPANVKGQQLIELVGRTDSIIIPVLSSQIDIDAVSKFVVELRKLPRVGGRCALPLLPTGRARTRSCSDLERFLLRSEFDFVARLRDTQNYMQAAETGLGIHELRGARVKKDVGQWAPVSSMGRTWGWILHAHDGDGSDPPILRLLGQPQRSQLPVSNLRRRAQRRRAQRIRPSRYQIGANTISCSLIIETGTSNSSSILNAEAGRGCSGYALLQAERLSAASFSMATAGSVLPSINSRNAPPPVLM